MFKVVGQSLDGQNITEEVAARNAKLIWSNPENFGFSKLYNVTAISNRRSRSEVRDSKYT